MQYVLDVKASMATEQVRKSDSQVSISPPPIVLRGEGGNDKEGRSALFDLPRALRGRGRRTC